MLAAASNRSSALSLFQVVLRAADDQPAVQVSGALRKHAIDVIRQAVQITSDPRAINAATAREAIELALQLRENKSLSQKLAAMPALDAISPELAKEVLASLKPSAA